MNAKLFLSACLLSLSVLSCQTQATLPQEESCPIDELPVIQPNIPPLARAAAVPTLEPVKMILAKEEPKAMPTQEEREMRLVLTAAKKPMIALQTISDASLAKGKATWLSKKEPLAMRRDVDLSALPEPSAAWVGQAVKLYKKDGTFCEATVTGLSLVGQLYIYNENSEKSSASKMFKLSQERGGVRLVGELDLESCEGALFARLASLPAPTIIAPEKAQKELRKTALAAMRSLSTYKTVQTRYNEYKQEQEDLKWNRWEYVYDASPEVLTLQTKTRTLVLTIAAQDGGCGDFYGSLFALWELNADSSLKLLYQGEDTLTPDFALDVNDDQTLEFFQGQSWKQLENGAYRTVDGLDIPFEEDVCGC